ncbi:MAG: FHA domain-containing protein [Kofleriaceae bacterium]
MSPSPDLVPEQLVGWTHETPYALVDHWGRLFRLGNRNQIGRMNERSGLAIVHPTVSRKHAMLVRSPEGIWLLIDHGSTNGTFVNGRSIPPEVETEIDVGTMLTFGKISFYLIQQSTNAIDCDYDELNLPTPPPIVLENRPVDPVPQFKPPPTHMQFVEAPSGGGGYLHLRGRQIRLSNTQFAMLSALARRLSEQRTVPELVRGFVPSFQLIAEIPWDAPSPNETHLKQLIRRTRKLLADVDDSLIESRRGFGYRLRITPRNLLLPETDKT